MRGSACVPLRVLVVDDNLDAAATLSFLLCNWGHEVRAAHDGPSAIAAACDFQPDAILLDIGLPRMDGFAVALHLRARPAFAHTLIVATSGYNHDRDLRRAAEVGIDLYLVKPFDPDRLKDLLAAPRPVEALPA